jgi:hypothetical protein
MNEEFEHYFRICLERTLSSEEAKSFLLLVNKLADAEPDEDDVVMYYHVDAETGRHCYDVRLADDITGDVGDDILHALEELFPDDDFDAESSMDAIAEEFVFDDLDITTEDLQQLNQNYSRWNHQRWVDRKVSEGWRLGMALDEQAKTHPDLRPWDDLLETYKPVSAQSVEYVLEQLRHLGYKLVK